MPCSHADVSNDTGCPILELPPELRNRIYDELLICSRAIPLTTVTRSLSWRCPALLQTSSQIRCEAASVYYSNNTFIVYRGNVQRSHNGDREHRKRVECGRVLVRWCQAIGGVATKMLRKLYFYDKLYASEGLVAEALKHYRDMLAVASVPLDSCLLFMEKQDHRGYRQWCASNGCVELARVRGRPGDPR